ncbi:MAG: hypothetical protein J7528_23695, partial [Caulobacter sp.]|nr:hypothetical protein [Caulobacter sp.]
NWYAYVGNDPMNKSDPTGLYICSGSKSDCGAISDYVNTAQNALSNLDSKSDAAKKLSATLNYLGAPGVKNGVTIQSASLRSGTMANAGPGGLIKVDIQQINATGARADYASANPGMTTSEIQRGVGATAVIHEARHELDFNRLGFPSNREQEYRTELNASRTGVGIGQGLNMNNGFYAPGATQQQMDDAVQKSAQ